MDLKYLFARGTSPVDWCEKNYRNHPLIAEFANTISNVSFLIASPILIYLFKDYANQINRGIVVIWLLFAGVGLASAYFHATLSLMGQLLDELTILWLLSTAFGMWIPRRYYPRIFRGDRSVFRKSVFGVSLFLTIMAWMYPWINAFVLVSLGVPSFYFLRLEFKRCRDIRAKQLCIRCAISWILAMSCWLCDRFLCHGFLEDLGLDFLHAFFHISISYTSITLCSLFAFFDVLNEHPETIPTLKLWPNDFFGIPYVAVKGVLL